MRETIPPAPCATNPTMRDTWRRVPFNTHGRRYSNKRQVMTINPKFRNALGLLLMAVGFAVMPDGPYVREIISSILLGWAGYLFR